MCTCFEGYTDDVTQPNHCRPTCTQQCINGKCSEPDVCQCFPGFAVTNNTEPNKCFPVCNEPCINSNCVAPDKCVCHDGFLPDLKFKNRCVMRCPIGCINGNCTANRTCECHEGWTGTNCSLQMGYMHDYPSINTMK
jgi:hypothetical protein